MIAKKKCLSKHRFGSIRYLLSESLTILPAGRLSFSWYGSWESASIMLFLLFEHQYIKRCDMHKVLGSCLADITCEPISMHQIQLSRFVVN